MATAEDSHRIEEIKPEIFQCLLRFIYGGELPANISEVSLKLFEVAHHYQIDELIDICKIEIEAKLSVDNAIDIYQIAQVYDLEDLKFTVWKFIKRYILKIFFALKHEPPTLQVIQMIIEEQEREKEFWKPLKGA